MHLRRSPGALLLIALASLVVLVAGCGGGGQSEGGGSQGGDSPGGKGQGGGEAAKQAPKPKVAVGTLVNVKPDRRRIVLRPIKELQGGERMVFRVRKNAEIQLDDKKADLSQAKKGQQAQIQYVTKNDRNRARVVDLFSAGNGGGGEGAG